MRSSSARASTFARRPRSRSASRARPVVRRRASLRRRYLPRSAGRQRQPRRRRHARQRARESARRRRCALERCTSWLAVRAVHTAHRRRRGQHGGICLVLGGVGNVARLEEEVARTVNHGLVRQDVGHVARGDLAEPGTRMVVLRRRFSRSRRSRRRVSLSSVGSIMMCLPGPASSRRTRPC